MSDGRIPRGQYAAVEAALTAGGSRLRHGRHMLASSEANMDAGVGDLQWLRLAIAAIGWSFDIGEW